MANYFLNEAVFDLPDRVFTDKTIHGLESKLPGDQKLGVFVHRRPIEAGKSLREVVDENIALNDMRLQAFKVLDQAETTVGGLPGILVRARWRHAGATFLQRQAHVAVGGKQVIFAVTTPLAEEAAGDETFASIVQSVTWRTV